MEREQLKIAIYARVSTKSGQDPEMQLAELREYIRNRRWKIAGESVDKGISGASDSRPAQALAVSLCISIDLGDTNGRTQQECVNYGNGMR